jgi:hypothetical protein
MGYHEWAGNPPLVPKIYVFQYCSKLYKIQQSRVKNGEYFGKIPNFFTKIRPRGDILIKSLTVREGASPFMIPPCSIPHNILFVSMVASGKASPTSHEIARPSRIDGSVPLILKTSNDLFVV